MHRLYILWINAIQTTFPYNTIHYIQRIITFINRTRTAHTNLYATAWHTTVFHLYTRNTSLQSIRNLRYRLILKAFIIKYSNRSCYISLTNSSITNNNNFIQSFSIFFQDYLCTILIFSRNLL